MPWAVKIAVEVIEMERGLGSRDEVAKRSYSFHGPLAHGLTLAAAVAKAEGEVHEYLVRRLEPAAVEEGH
jgi:hypothetical protein